MLKIHGNLNYLPRFKKIKSVASYLQLNLFYVNKHCKAIMLKLVKKK